MKGDCSPPPTDRYICRDDHTAGLIGKGDKLLFNTHSHFRLKDQNGSSLFHSETEILEYQLAEYHVPTLQSHPMMIREVLNHFDLKHELIHRGFNKLERDYTRPSVTVDNGAFTLFHIGHTTFFRYDAFWAFPPTIYFERLQSLWWSFAVQRLLWLTGSKVHVIAMPFVQYDLQISKRGVQTVNATLSNLLSFLGNWKCNDLFQKCAKRLFKDLNKHSYLSMNELNLVIDWLSILNLNGYKWPKVIVNEETRHITSVQLTRSVESGAHSCPVKDCVTKDVEKSYNVAYQQSRFDKTNYDIILLIQFNHKTYSAIPLIEYLYRPAFKHIIYCGPDEMITSYNVNFVVFNGEDHGALFYTCAAFVLQIAFNVKGVLLISDDVIINFHRWDLIDKSRNLISYADTDGIRLYDTETMKRCFNNVYVCTNPPIWWWMKTTKHTEAVRAAYDDMFELENKDSDVQQALSRMSSNYGGRARMLSAYSDMFYIPQSRGRRFIRFSQLFEKHKIFVENAVPTISSFISNSSDIQLEKAIQMSYGKNRTKPWLRWPEIEGSLEFMYIHPVKLGTVNKDSNIKELFCKSIIPEMIRSLTALNEKNVTRKTTMWDDILYIK